MDRPAEPRRMDVHIGKKYLCSHSAREVPELTSQLASRLPRNQREERKNSTGSAIGTTLWHISFSIFMEDQFFLITPSPTPVATAEFATLAPTASPTTFLESGQPFAPTSARFADVVQEILLQFESPTLEVAILNPSSPQHRAALWMTEIDAHNSTASLSFPLNDTDSMLEFRQRYALVTLYYSTGGEQWVDRCNFVSANLHVCGWQCPFPDGDAGDTADLWLNFQYMGVTCFDTIGGDPGSSVIAVEIGK